MADLAELWAKFADVWRETFHERELMVRSRGQMRYIVLSSKLQQIGAFAGAGLVIWMLVATSSLLIENRLIASKSNEVDRAKSQVEALTADIEEMRRDYKETTDELITNHRLIEELVQDRHLLDTDALDATVAKPVATETGQDILGYVFDFLGGDGSPSEEIDSAEALRTEQLALLQELEERASADTDHLVAAVQMTGLDVDTYLHGLSMEGAAQGGPLQLSRDDGPEAPGSAVRNYHDEPNEFTRLYFSAANNLSRLADLKAAVTQLPLITPIIDTEEFYLSSSYGRRRDPITAQPAFHAGIDLGGHRKTPIRATATGVIIKAGISGPYGNMIEVDHDNGFRTRYGHLHTINVAKGDLIEAGDIIGTMGSSGRTTGTHVHYEIWYDDQTMDPAKFLKAGKHVQQDRQI